MGGEPIQLPCSGMKWVHILKWRNGEQEDSTNLMKRTPFIALSILCIALVSCASTGTDPVDRNASNGRAGAPQATEPEEMHGHTHNATGVSTAETSVKGNSATVIAGNAMESPTKSTTTTDTTLVTTTNNLNTGATNTTSVSGTSGTGMSGTTDNTATISGTGTMSGNTSTNNSTSGTWNSNNTTTTTTKTTTSGNMTSSTSTDDDDDTTTSTTETRRRMRKD